MKKTLLVIKLMLKDLFAGICVVLVSLLFFALVSAFVLGFVVGIGWVVEHVFHGDKGALGPYLCVSLGVMVFWVCWKWIKDVLKRASQEELAR